VSPTGTAAYDGRADLPPLVATAVALARRTGFAYSCRPEQGDLLRLLAGGVGAGVIGETGTGCGVGLAWLVTGAGPGATLVSVERAADRAAAAREVFAGRAEVTIVDGDWRDLPGAPFDLLVLDGGGQGKGTGEPLDPVAWLKPGGLLVIDDFTPMTTWPPMHDGRPDEARLHWLRHPRLAAAEVRVAPDAATIVATFLG
jgi:predicted O-methyltransferase YrrM